MKALTAFVGILLIGGAVFAQHGSAKNGYYPDTYAGDTWTGVVTSVNENTGEFTLTYTKGTHVETFMGIPEAGYLVAPKNGPQRLLKLSDIRVGATVTVEYTPSTTKIDGKKVTTNTVIYINLIPNNIQRSMRFKAFQ